MWPVQVTGELVCLKPHLCIPVLGSCVKLLGNKLPHTLLHLQVLVTESIKVVFK